MFVPTSVSPLRYQWATRLQTFQILFKHVFSCSSPRINPKDLYTWASSELLDECSCLLSTRAIREHKGDSCSYNHRAFARRHDDDIVVLPCALGEPICGDERANDGVPFFYFYQVVFKTIGVRLPFSRFEKELLTEINAAPAQLYPNSWAFVKAFDILFGVSGLCTLG